ncbi:hypothetical protein [Candidatus Pelagibacter sp. Uisw_136]|uniref:hypothetical protein n=1 Tax=Candidatus Pelagibacter sp. Uisw_136 TaxID=3230991 RepID=UPI0039E884D5
MIKKIFLVSFSLLVGVILVEILYKNLDFDKASDKYKDVLSIYSLWTDKNKSGGRANIKNKIWTYDKNNQFHHRVFIKTNKEWLEEFQYKFNSNNFGLNQETDIILNKKSIAIFGASVPEGWGASPWLNDLQKEFTTDFQLVNGSLHGTGVYSWRVLHDHLKEQNIKIEKILMFLHGDFWVNVSKTIPQNQIDCLRDYKLCDNPSFLQYGFPNNADDEEIIQFLINFEKIRNSTISNKAKYITSLKEFLFYLREMMPATYQLYRVSRIKYNQYLNQNEIKKFITEYKDNLIIFHIPQQNEYIQGKLTNDSISLIKFVKSNGGIIFNSLERCEKSVADDFFYYEGHPNLKGYKKLKECTKKALKELISK